MFINLKRSLPCVLGLAGFTAVAPSPQGAQGLAGAQKAPNSQVKTGSGLPDIIITGTLGISSNSFHATFHIGDTQFAFAGVSSVDLPPTTSNVSFLTYKSTAQLVGEQHFVGTDGSLLARVALAGFRRLAIAWDVEPSYPETSISGTGKWTNSSSQQSPVG